MQNAVSYYRVSTERQGESGLGLEAQRATIYNFIIEKKIQLLKEFTEVESGKKNKRPVLLNALEFCKKNKAVLIIAKLNRLGRNVAFISSLMDSKVKFVIVENPEASRFILHILAAVSEYQLEETSINTKAALQAAKKRGVNLGKNGKALAEKNKVDSKIFYDEIIPKIKKLQKKGFKTVRAITDELNRISVPTFRNTGTKWHLSTVHKLIKNSIN